MITELKCDYDSVVFPRALSHRIRVVCRYQRLRVVFVRIEKTRRGFHIVVGVAGRVAFARQVLIQTLLGSDWKRELFNSRRAMAWRDVPAFWRRRANVLYDRHTKGVLL